MNVHGSGRMWLTVVLVLVLGLALVASVSFGATGFVWPFGRSGMQAMLDYRMAHTLVALFCGAALASSGVVMQAILANPLAEPYILGISGGAAAGALLSMLLGVQGLQLLALFAFVGSVLAVWIVLFLASKTVSLSNSSALILIGVMLNVLFSAFIVLFVVMSNKTAVNELLFWLMGRLGMWTVDEALPIVLPGMLLLLLLMFGGHKLNLLSLGEQRAYLLGTNPAAMRIGFILVSSALVAVSVALGGIIGFVGLVVPHALRLIAGGDNRFLLGASAIAGAAFLLVSDTIARTVLAPSELPIGAITAFVGAPFFLWMIARFGHGHTS